MPEESDNFRQKKKGAKKGADKGRSRRADVKVKSPGGVAKKTNRCSH